MSILEKISSIKDTLNPKNPIFLTAVGVAGVIVVGIMAAKATPKAEENIKVAKENKAKDPETANEEFTKMDTFKAAAPAYAGTVVAGAVACACIIGAATSSNKKQAALISAWTIAQSKSEEITKAVQDAVGPVKTENIKKAARQATMDKTHTDEKTVIVTGGGETLCYDLLSGRYFNSNIETLRQCENELNKQLLNDMFMSVNDVYYKIGLDGIKLGNDIGWDVNYDGMINFEFSAQLTESGKPCLALDYLTGPHPERK